MPLPSNNTIVIAAAGSRKTTHLVNEAISAGPHPVLVTTFTIENLDELRQAFIRKVGCVPAHVTLQSWYSFILKDCVRPYQRSVIAGSRIDSMLFESVPVALQRVPRSQAARYYLTRTNRIYRDRLSDFAHHANMKSGGAVIRRLEQVYAAIFIDEMQDLAGLDFDVIDSLLASRIRLFCVADPRQTTLSTAHTRTNCAFRGLGLMTWIQGHTSNGRLILEERNVCYRSSQEICDFADALFPTMPKTISKSTTQSTPFGIMVLARADLKSYVSTVGAVILRHDKRANCNELPAFNFGAVKGRTFDHVVVIATKPIAKYFKTRSLVGFDNPSRLYVAVTRARFSVAFVLD